MADLLQAVPQNDLPATGPAPIDPIPAAGAVPSNDLPTAESTYGTTGQQALTIGEGVAHGFAGPVATAAEAGLTKLGVNGLSPEDQAARAQTNPTAHITSEIGGFGLGALTGTGEAGLLAKVGEGAGGSAQGAGIVSKIAQTGIKTGAEMAALQYGDEISKAINQNPGQTLGNAAINIGLSGILGGAGGAVLGSVSPLFKSAANKIGVAKLATDFMGELKLLQDKPDLAAEAARELSQRETEVSTLKAVAPEETSKIELAEDNPAALKASRNRALNPNPVEPFNPTEDQPIKNLIRPGAPLFLKESQKAADKIAQAAIENGAEIPNEALLNPTPALDNQLGNKASPGQLMARWAYSKGAEKLANAFGDVVASTVGGVAGSVAGHPLFGAYLGDKILAPVVSSLAKPFAENAINSEAMKASVDYLTSAVRGEITLSKSVKNFFMTGEVVPKFLLPDDNSRTKLEKSLEASQNPQNILQVGGNISHYLPNHGTQAAALAGTAVTYLNSIKPTQAPSNPFDATPPIDKAAQAKYNRALDVAQQPLIVLKHAQEGTLLPQDVQTLHTIYPGLHSSMVSKLNDELIVHQSAGKSLPYGQRVSLSLLTGSPLDSTMTPQTMQAVIRSAGTQQAAVAANKASKGKTTGAQLDAIEKTTNLYPTSLQQRQLDKRN